MFTCNITCKYYDAKRRKKASARQKKNEKKRPAAPPWKKAEQSAPPGSGRRRLPAIVAVRIVGGDRPIRVEIESPGNLELGNSEDSTVPVGVVAEHNQHIFSGAKPIGIHMMDAGRLPVVIRMGLFGDLSEEVPVQPGPGFIINRPEEQLNIAGRSKLSGQFKFQPIPEEPIVFRQLFELHIEISRHPNRTPSGIRAEIRVHPSPVAPLSLGIGDADPTIVRQLIVQVAAIAVETADLPPEATVYFISSSSRVSFLNSTLPEEPKLAGSNARLVAPSGIS